MLMTGKQFTVLALAALALPGVYLLATDRRVFIKACDGTIQRRA